MIQVQLYVLSESWVDVANTRSVGTAEWTIDNMPGPMPRCPRHKKFAPLTSVTRTHWAASAGLILWAGSQPSVLWPQPRLWLSHCAWGGGGDQTLNILCQPLGTKQATRPASLLRAPRGDNGEFQMKDLLDTRLTRVVLATYLLVLAAAV